MDSRRRSSWDNCNVSSVGYFDKKGGESRLKKHCKSNQGRLAKHILGKYCRISQLRIDCILNKICVGFTLIFLFGCLVLSNGKVLAENAVDIGKLCNLMVQVPKENRA